MLQFDTHVQKTPIKMEEENAYERERAQRIKRNKEMMSQLQVTSLAEQLGKAGDAAADAEARRKAEKLAALQAVGPRRRSTRPTAQQTRELLAKHTQRSEGDGDRSEADAEDDDGDASEQSASLLEDSGGRKRARHDDAQEDDYDPLEEELSEDSKEHDEESEADDEESDGAAKRHGKAAARKATPACKGGPSMPAAEAGARAGHGSQDSEDEDEELQQALAASLLEAQQGPSRSIAEPSTRNSFAQAPAASSASAAPGSRSEVKQQPAAAAQPAGKDRKTHGKPPAAAIKGQAADGEPAGGGKKGGQRRKRKAAPLEGSEADLQKAFAMLAGSKSAIGVAGLQRMWKDVRGGELDDGAAEHMLTYAAEATGQQGLTFPVFKELIAVLNS